MGAPPGSSGAGAALGPRLTARLALLTASLRAGGVRTGVGELLAAHRALAAVDATSREDAYLALRTTLYSRREDLEVFEAVFEATFPAAGRPPAPPALDEAAHLVLPRAPGEARGGRGGEPLTRGMRAALPNTDHLLAGNSIASLEALAELLEKGTKN